MVSCYTKFVKLFFSCASSAQHFWALLLHFAHLCTQKCLAQSTQLCDLGSLFSGKQDLQNYRDWYVHLEGGAFRLLPQLETLALQRSGYTGPVMICTWKNTHLNARMRSSHPLCPASGSCSVKSGFFLLSMETFSQPVKSLLLGAGPHPGPLSLHGCLTAFKRICYARTIVAPLKTLVLFFFVFHQGKKAFYCHFHMGRKKVLKNDNRLVEEGWCSYFGLVSQTITNSGSDDILILSPVSLWNNTICVLSSN